MAVDVIGAIEQMAELGTAPDEGCALFGVGYEDAFERLRMKYIEQRFSRGSSAEKFVIGPYGSGKTHFLRQLMEIGRQAGCVTAEVKLTKDVDFTKSIIVYREVVSELRAPDADQRGIRPLLAACLDRVRSLAQGDDAKSDILARGWISSLDKQDFELEPFGRVLRRGLEAHLNQDSQTFEAACRWLAGDVGDRVLARDLAVSVVSKSEENIHGNRALLSLFQFIRSAGFRGTVVTFDEAEQGLNQNRKTMDRILSMLQSRINAIADLKKGSALIVYAFTPDLIEQMERLAALQQRVADPGPGMAFFDGNTLAPRIELTRRDDPEGDLRAIGRRCVNLAYDSPEWRCAVPRAAMLATIDQLATEIALEEISSSSRRTMAKRTCATLMRALDDGVLDTAPRSASIAEDEV
jgi:hypothetical protein